MSTEASKYVEGMPITAMVKCGDNILIAGGGGDPAFGKPNKAVLVDADRNILDEIEMPGVVESASAQGSLVVFSFMEGMCEILRVAANKISAPARLPAEFASPVICNNRLYYINSQGKVVTEVASRYVEVDGEPELAEISCPEGKIIKLLAINNTISCVTEKLNELMVKYNGRTHVLDGDVEKYVCTENSFGYLCQMKNARSVVTLLDKKIRTVIGSRLTCLSTDGAHLVCGSGDGYVSMYRDNKLILRRQIFDFPITSIVVLKGTAYCSTLDGRVLTQLIPREGRALRKALLFVAAGLVLAVVLDAKAARSLKGALGNALCWALVRAILLARRTCQKCDLSRLLGLS